MNFTLAEREETRRSTAAGPLANAGAVSDAASGPVNGQANDPTNGSADGQPANAAFKQGSGHGASFTNAGVNAQRPPREPRQPHQARRTLNLVDRSLLPPPPDWVSFGLMALALAGLLSAGAHGLLERRSLALALAASAPAESGDQEATEDPEWRQLTEQTARRSALRTALRTAGAGAENLSAVLGAVSAALPPDMWLNEIEMQQGPSLRIEGQALTMTSLLRFTQGLSNVDVLRGMPVQSVQVQTQWPEHGAAAEVTSATPGDAEHTSKLSAGKAAVPVHQFRLSAGVLKDPS